MVTVLHTFSTVVELTTPGNAHAMLRRREGEKLRVGESFTASSFVTLSSNSHLRGFVCVCVCLHTEPCELVQDGLCFSRSVGYTGLGFWGGVVYSLCVLTSLYSQLN